MSNESLQIAAVFVSQMSLIFFKHVGVRVIVKEQVLKSMFFTSLIQASWLVSSAIGISAFLKGNWIVVCFYLAGGVMGTYLNFKIKV
ncbi:MAG: hypothetical protein AB7D96_10560 [Arcobacteraceae bacterium]